MQGYKPQADLMILKPCLWLVSLTACGLEVTDRQTYWRVDQCICRSSKPFFTANAELEA